MKMTDKKIENLIEGDNFVHDGETYFVLENAPISTSFNEIKVASEDGNHNLRLRKTCMVTLSEKKTPKLNKPFRTSGGPKKFSVHVRNSTTVLTRQTRPKQVIGAVRCGRRVSQ